MISNLTKFKKYLQDQQNNKNHKTYKAKPDSSLLLKIAENDAIAKRKVRIYSVST